MARKPGAWSYDTQGYASYQSGAPVARSAVQPSESFVRLTEMISGGIQRMVLNGEYCEFLRQIPNLNFRSCVDIVFPKVQKKLVFELHCFRNLV